VGVGGWGLGFGGGGVGGGWGGGVVGGGGLGGGVGGGGWWCGVLFLGGFRVPRLSQGPLRSIDPAGSVPAISVSLSTVGFDPPPFPGPGPFLRDTPRRLPVVFPPCYCTFPRVPDQRPPPFFLSPFERSAGFHRRFLFVLPLGYSPGGNSAPAFFPQGAVSIPPYSLFFLVFAVFFQVFDTFPSGFHLSWSSFAGRPLSFLGLHPFLALFGRPHAGFPFFFLKGFFFSLFWLFPFLEVVNDFSFFFFPLGIWLNVVP